MTFCHLVYSTHLPDPANPGGRLSMTAEHQKPARAGPEGLSAKGMAGSRNVTLGSWENKQGRWLLMWKDGRAK